MGLERWMAKLDRRRVVRKRRGFGVCAMVEGEWNSNGASPMSEIFRSGDYLRALAKEI